MKKQSSGLCCPVWSREAQGMMNNTSIRDADGETSCFVASVHAVPRVWNPLAPSQSA